MRLGPVSWHCFAVFELGCVFCYFITTCSCQNEFFRIQLLIIAMDAKFSYEMVSYHVTFLKSVFWPAFESLLDEAFCEERGFLGELKLIM